VTGATPLRLLVCAEEAAGVQLLRSLGDLAAHRTIAVLTRPDSAQTVTVSSVARGLDLEVLPAELVRDASFADWIRQKEVDLLLNVHSLYVAHADVVRAPRVGSFNLHPGPLPRYAGLNAPSWAIFNGEAQHGVTLHWMAPGIDTGAIVFQALFGLSDSDTGLTVGSRCVRLGVPLVLQLLEVAAESPEGIPAVPQDPELRTYYGADPPNEGNVRWDWSAATIERLVRASDFFPLPSPWGSPAATLGTRTIGISRAVATEAAATERPGTVRAAPGEDVEVAAGDAWLRVERLAVDGDLVAPAQMLSPGDVLGDGRLRRG
jgi:methionyl-tRNA formyltransferase